MERIAPRSREAHLPHAYTKALVNRTPVESAGCYLRSSGFICGKLFLVQETSSRGVLLNSILATMTLVKERWSFTEQSVPSVFHPWRCWLPTG
jgi:hypothetical protein